MWEGLKNQMLPLPQLGIESGIFKVLNWFLPYATAYSHDYKLITFEPKMYSLQFLAVFLCVTD